MMLTLALAPLLFITVNPQPVVTATTEEYALPDSVLLEPGILPADAASSPRLTPATLSPAPRDRPNFGLNTMLGAGVLGAATIGLGLVYLVTSSGDPTAGCPTTSFSSTCVTQHQNQEDQQSLAGTLLLSIGSVAMTTMILIGALNLATDEPSTPSTSQSRSVPLSVAPMLVHDGAGLAVQAPF